MQFCTSSAITPKSEDKYVVKVFNCQRSEVHLSEMNYYKIHTLGRQEYSPCKLGPEAFVFLFRFRSVGVLAVVTGFSGLGSTPVPALE